MKTILHDWHEYNKNEKVAVIVQLAASIIVVVTDVLNLLNVTNNNIIIGIGLCVVMIAQFYRLRHSQKSISAVSLTLAILIALLVIKMLLIKNNIIG